VARLDTVSMRAALPRFLLGGRSMGDGSSLFRRALYRRITVSEETPAVPPAAPPPRVEAAPPPPPVPPRAPSGWDDGRYGVVGVSRIDLVDPSRRCALVVEDNDVLREGMAAMLDDAGWVVVEADSLDRARALLGVVRPNVLLLDYDLHGEYASVLLDELAHARRMTPTVLVSACPLAFDAARAYGLELLTKPFPIEGLMGKLDHVLGRRHASVPTRLAR
jgi:CheY-like chemotaxis protein